ncbi:hypothetical protein LSB85_004654 [Salmonella enterica]|nr:hypothetical protein [Salmonella enterica]
MISICGKSQEEGLKERSIISGCYLNASFWACLGVWLSIETQHFLWDWFVIASVFLVLHWWFYRTRSRPHYIVPPVLFLLPILLTTVGTAHHIRQEADTGEYQEIVNCLHWTTNTDIRQKVIIQVRTALEDDGKLSVAEASLIRRFILSNIGILMRADAADTQKLALERLTAELESEGYASAT